MTYDVHIFAIVRLKVPAVAGSDQREAIRNALNSIDLYRELQTDRTEYAEEIARYVVDEVGDSEYANSRTYLDKDHLEYDALDEKCRTEVIDVSEAT